MTLSSRTTTILAVLLVASVAVNFFIAGIFFSHSGRPHFRMSGARPENTVSMRGEPGGLSKEGMATIRMIIQSRGEDVRKSAEAMSAAQDAIREALKAEPFDPDALDKAQARMGSAMDNIQAAFRSNMTQIAAQLSDEDRAALAKLPVQSPMVAFRHRDMRNGDMRHGGGPNSRFFRQNPPPGATTPPAPDGER